MQYQAYNITGFLFYTMYCVSNYVVQHQEAGLTQSVEVNDLVFVIHAVIMTSVVISQCVRYKLKSHNLNKWHVYLVCVFWLLFAYNLALVAAGILPWVNRTPHYRYTVCEYLGYVKVCISFVKYCPQAYMNWSRKSTVGWAVGNVLLDLTGGLLALGQQSIEAYRQGNTSEFTSNIAKLLLSMESIAFDLLFIVQHYVLYRKNNAALERAATATLTRDEQEALEADTQARAKAAAAALLGATVGGALIGAQGVGYQSITDGSSAANGVGVGSGSGSDDPESQKGGAGSGADAYASVNRPSNLYPVSPPAPFGAEGGSGTVDLRALGSRRDSDTNSQRTHLLPPGQRRAPSEEEEP